MQHCNNKRYTFGIIIGSIYTLVSSIIFSVSVFSYVDSHHDRATSEIISASLVTALISALFVYAIVKKQHNLILPWLLLCVAIFIGSCIFTLILFFALAWLDFSDDICFLLLLISVILIGIEIGIFWFSCWLYREIRKYNLEQISNVVVTYNNETNNYMILS